MENRIMKILIIVLIIANVFTIITTLIMPSNTNNSTSSHQPAPIITGQTSIITVNTRQIKITDAQLLVNPNNDQFLLKITAKNTGSTTMKSLTLLSSIFQPISISQTLQPGQEYTWQITGRASLNIGSRYSFTIVATFSDETSEVQFIDVTAKAF
jgi:hypothetical protein